MNKKVVGTEVKVLLLGTFLLRSAGRAKNTRKRGKGASRSMGARESEARDQCERGFFLARQK